MIKFWTKYWSYLALPIMLGVVAYAYVSPGLNYKFFCEGTESCFREWVGALSGWAAAVAAFFTIRTMNQTQRQNVDIQLQRDITLARIVRRRCLADKKRLILLEPLKTLRDEPTYHLTHQEAMAFRKLMRSFDQPDFDEFARIEFVGATYLRSARTSLRYIQDLLLVYRGFDEGVGTRNILEKKEFRAMRRALTHAEGHNKRLLDAADKFIARWEYQGISF